MVDLLVLFFVLVCFVLIVPVAFERAVCCFVIISARERKSRKKERKRRGKCVCEHETRL